MKPEDVVIHVGDVFIDKAAGWDAIWPKLPGRKWLIIGNHDKHHGASWWCEHGFDFAADAIIFRRAFITHKPSAFLPGRCDINIHGHLHNIWHGFHNGDPQTEKITRSGRLKNPWQRLFAIEYTGYAPVDYERFVSHPDKYQARGPLCTTQKRQSGENVSLPEKQDCAPNAEKESWIEAKSNVSVVSIMPQSGEEKIEIVNR